MQIQLGRAEEEVKGNGELRGIALLLKNSPVVHGHPQPHLHLPF